MWLMHLAKRDHLVVQLIQCRHVKAGQPGVEVLMDLCLRSIQVYVLQRAHTTARGKIDTGYTHTPDRLFLEQMGQYPAALPQNSYRLDTGFRLFLEQVGQFPAALPQNSYSQSQYRLQTHSTHSALEHTGQCPAAFHRTLVMGYRETIGRLQTGYRQATDRSNKLSGQCPAVHPQNNYRSSTQATNLSYNNVNLVA